MKSFLSDRPRVTLPSGSAAPASPQSAFTSLLGGNHAHASSVPQSPAQAAARPVAPAQVECVRDGTTITRLIVTCGCGERIEIDCLYPSAH